MSNLVFNPAYSLKDDMHRVLLVDTPSFNVDALINFIHPEYAFILSCFNGKNTSHEAVLEVATHFGLNYNDARKIIVTIQRTRRCSRRLEKGEDCVVGRVAVLLGCLDDSTFS